MKKDDENKKSLDEYFDLAKEEKVKYSKEDTKKLIVKYGTAAGAIGIFSNFWLKSIFNLKFITMSLVTVGSGLGIYYTVFKDSNGKQIENYNTAKIKSKNIITTETKEISKNNLDKIEDKIEAKVNEYIQNEVDNNSTNSKKINTSNIEKENISNEIESTANAVSNSKLSKKENDIYNNQAIENRNEDINNNLQKNLESSQNDESFEQSNKPSYIAINKSEYESSQAVNDVVYLQPAKFVEKEYVYTETDHTEKLKTLVYDFAKDNDISITALIRDTKILGKNSVINGGKILWTIDDRFSAGLFGFGLSNPGRDTYTTNEGVEMSGNMQLGYGGGILEYNFAPNEFFNYSATLGLGFGGASMVLDNSADVNATALWTTFYVVEPGISAELSFFNLIKLGAEVSYRYSNNFQKEYLYKNDSKVDNMQLSGFSAGLSVKVIIF